tara:strand:- start:24 stop:488 length:465 start_codon:yes stop_codon:yes gene_type:complete
MAIKGFRHSGIVVKDMEKSMQFYCKMLNHKVIVDFIEEGKYFEDLIGISNARARVVKAGLPDKTFVELIQFLNIDYYEKSFLGFNFRGCNHICFNDDDIETTYSSLVENGVNFITPPLASEFDPVKTCFCRDPDGTLVQFVEVTDVENIQPGLE